MDVKVGKFGGGLVFEIECLVICLGGVVFECCIDLFGMFGGLCFEYMV